MSDNRTVGAKFAEKVPIQFPGADGVYANKKDATAAVRVFLGAEAK